MCYYLDIFSGGLEYKKTCNPLFINPHLQNHSQPDHPFRNSLFSILSISCSECSYLRRPSRPIWSFLSFPRASLSTRNAYIRMVFASKRMTDASLVSLRFKATIWVLIVQFSYLHSAGYVLVYTLLRNIHTPYRWQLDHRFKSYKFRHWTEEQFQDWEY